MANVDICMHVGLWWMRWVQWTLCAVECGLILLDGTWLAVRVESVLYWRPLCCLCVPTTPTPVLHTVVFDGHSGFAAADWLNSNMYQIICDVVNEDMLGSADASASTCVCGWWYGNVPGGAVYCCSVCDAGTHAHLHGLSCGFVSMSKTALVLAAGNDSL